MLAAVALACRAALACVSSRHSASPARPIGSFPVAICCRLQFTCGACSAGMWCGGDYITASPQTAPCYPIVEEPRYDADALLASSKLRSLRWRGRITISGTSRGPFVLVPDMARASGSIGARQQTHRCDAARDRRLGRREQSIAVRSCCTLYFDAFIFVGSVRFRGAEGLPIPP